jgi:hypothetical protein
MTRAQRKASDNRYRKWHGAYKPYDLVKEATIAIVAVLALSVVLAVLFSPPDEPPITMKSWSHAAPLDFATIAAQELDADSGTAGYGPPYNHAADGQHMLFIYPAKWLGVSHPIDTTQDFVIGPLRSLTSDATLQSAINTYEAASPTQRAAWGAAYETALTKGSTNPDGTITVRAGDYGPVATMIAAELDLAQSGGLDGALLTSKQFYQTDYTKILMFLQDDNGAGAYTGGNGYFNDVAASQHLLGSPQWGTMNETGSFPGQVWLWLYTFWYQIKPFSTSANADLLVMALMTLLSIGLICVPFLPVIRDIPRKIPIYKLIWRVHYRSLR